MLLARRRPGVWGLAGIGPNEMSQRVTDDEWDGAGLRSRILMAGSAPS